MQAFKPSPTDRVASGARKSVRPVQCGSQAVAQNHQGPPGLHVLRALALLQERGSPRRQYLWSPMEVLRLSRPVVRGVNRAVAPKLVSTKTANGGGEGQPLAA